LIKKKFGEGVKKEIIETSGKTNIFRWCASKDLFKCHIGDPDHPDNTTWVTNEKDFEALRKKDINVVLQTETSKSAKSESEGDLSTLFLILRDLINVSLAELVEKFDKMIETAPTDFEKIIEIILKFFVEAAASVSLEKLRYINIETPGKRLSQQTDEERIRNYEAILEVLKEIGLHCCGEDLAKSEKNIKEGLKIGGKE
jgi:hypothetical protein